MEGKKKRLVSLLVTLCMVLTIAVPAGVWADTLCEHDYSKDAVCAVCGNAPELTDAQKASWKVYYDMRTALAGDDLDALKAASETFEEVNEENDMDMESVQALKAMDEDYWVIVFTSNVVITASGYYDAFVADKNAKTAYDFVEYYGMEDVEPSKADIERFMPDIESLYAEAQENMPSEAVLAVYEAYANVQDVLNSWSVDESTYAAVETFAAVTEIFNELTEAELADLALLIGAEDAEAAWNQVFNDWVTLNIIVNVDAVYQAYANEPNAETAQALVDMYDSIFNDPNYNDPDMEEVIQNFFLGIDDVYADAKALLEPADENPAGPGDSEESVVPEDPEEPVTPVAPEDLEEAEDTEEPDEAPETGDQTPFALWLSVLMLAVIVLTGMKAVSRKE